AGISRFDLGNFFNQLHSDSLDNNVLLSDDEFDICRELVIVLKPFDELSEILKTSKYPASSVIVPAIKTLKQHLKNYQPKNEVIQHVKDAILNNLKKSWDVPETLGLYGSFFEPYFKKLLYINSELQYQIINNLREQYSKLAEPETFNSIIISQDSKMESFFQPFQLPMSEEYNPLKWWNENKLEFPTMAKLARKYLAILASCIPNRELFLDEKIYDLDLDD
ncbi:35800_t:CDS:2, partial [Racocetra persica]